MQLSINLCSFSSTCFGLLRPSSGAMDVTISSHMQYMVSLVTVLRIVCAGGVQHATSTHIPRTDTLLHQGHHMLHM